jgi:hypothetical protein
MDLASVRGAIVLGMALVVTAAGGAATRAVDIGLKDRVNAYPSMAAAGRFAVLAWGASAKEAVTDVYVAVSHDSGRSFGTPTRVNRAAEAASLSGEQPPRIALVARADRDPAIVVMWTGKGADGARLFTSRSEDSGRTFGASVPVPGSEAPGNRGWESIAASRDGSVVALWLDHRELAVGNVGAAVMNHAEHQHLATGQGKTEGVARAQLSKLFFARLGKPDSARRVAGGVCYCCKTSIATDREGVVYAAWRNVYEGNVRDIAFSKSSDGGNTFASPVRVSNDHWVLDGCPENGPALAVDSRNRIHVAWPTLVPGAAPGGEPTLALFYATSQDGRHFTRRQQIPTEGLPRHSQIAAGPRGELVVAWDEQSPGVKRIALARGALDENGTARFVRQAIGDAAPATYPVVASVEGGTIVAWTSGERGHTVVRVERLPN